MKRLLASAVLLIMGTAYGQVSYDITIGDIPNTSSGDIIGIPRQQAVCLSGAGELVVMWDGDDFYKTTDRGQTWCDTLLHGIVGSIVHNHLAVWEDTIYNFSSYYDHSGIFQVQILETGSLTQVHQVFIDTMGFAGGGNIQPSGQPSGNPDEMVLFIRGGETNDCGAYWISHDRGRTWDNQHAEIADYGGGGTRMGMVRVADSCLALIYSGTGDIDVWHFRPSDTTWVQEAGGHFIHTTWGLQRVFSAAVVGDTVYVLAVNGDVSTYFVAKSAVGSGAITHDTLWVGPPAHADPPEYIGYGALQVIQGLNTVVAFYVHPDDGSSGPNASRLYMRLYFDGVWQPETLVSGAARSVNLTCPFVVPASHGNYAYCEFHDIDGGHLAAVRINTRVTRADIDRAILGFREGRVTLEEVLELIERYNAGQ